jgi:hypothetical protein
MDAEEAVLQKLNVDYDLPETGCCGMAGAFGFENDHYDISMLCGERVLLPAVRNAASDALIITDGFSCQEQIAQSTNRRAVHLAEAIQAAIHQKQLGEFPERQLLPTDNGSASFDLHAALALGAGALMVGGGLWVGLRYLHKRREQPNEIQSSL